MNSLSKGDKIKYQKFQEVLKEQMSHITDESAITIHGLNSELKLLRLQMKTHEEAKEPAPLVDLEALK